MAVGIHCREGGSSQLCVKFQRAVVDLKEGPYLFIQPGITHLSGFSEERLKIEVDQRSTDLRPTSTD